MATRSTPTVSCRPGEEGELELGPDAVGARHQQRLPVASGQGAQPREAPEIGHHLGAEGAPDVSLDALDQRVAGVDVDAGVAVGEPRFFLRHRGRYPPSGVPTGVGRRPVPALLIGGEPKRSMNRRSSRSSSSLGLGVSANRIQRAPGADRAAELARAAAGHEAPQRLLGAAAGVHHHRAAPGAVVHRPLGARLQHARSLGGRRARL